MGKVLILMKEKSTRDLVIEILSKDWPLSPKSIYNRVKKQNLKQITYQAVFKVIKKMLEEAILDKNDGKYSLDLAWINQSKEFFDQIESTYTKGSSDRVPFINAHMHDYVKYSFDTLQDLAIFVVKYFLDFPNPKKKPIALRLFTVYTQIGQPSSNIKKIIKFARKNDFYVICKHKTLYDRFMAKAYKKIDKKMNFALGVDCSDEVDYFVIGDYVARIFFPPNSKKRINRFRKESKSLYTFNLKDLLHNMYKKTSIPTTIIIERDPEIAKRVRESIMNYF